MCSARPSFAPEGLGDRLRDERGVAERGEPDPEDACLVLGDERGGGLEREPGLPEPPGPVSVRRRAPPSIRARTSSSSRSRPTKELAGRGRFVFEIVLSGGKLSSPSWKIGDRVLDVLQAVLAEVGEPEAVEEVARCSQSTIWPPCPVAATRAAKCTSLPT